MDKDINIVQGDDYAVADGRALLFTSAGDVWPDLTAATITLKFIAPDAEAAALSVTGTRSLVGTVQHITVPLTAAQTQPLAAGTNAYDYALQAVLSGRRLTLRKGKVTIAGGVA